MKPKRKIRVKYMHTIDNRPAHYYTGEQVCFAVKTRPIPLCATLADIKREQKLSNAWRESRGMEHYFKLGWVKVAV